MRLEKNLSQEELGEKIGVQKAAINKYETGIVVNLKRGIIVKLAEALDTTPAYLMGWSDDPERTFWDDVVTQGEESENNLPDEDTLKLAEELRNRPGMRLLFDAAKSCKEEDLINVADFISKLRKGDDD